MLWLFLSLGAALSVAAADAFAKEAVRKTPSEAVAWARAGWSALFLLPLVAFGAPPSDARLFWTTVGLMLPMEAAAALLYQAALRRSPLSVTVPYLAFTPVFLLGVGWLVLGERPTAFGVVGVVLVTAGAYVLQTERVSGKPFFRRKRLPFAAGSLLMLAVAFLYAFTSSLGKKAVMASSPLYFSGVYFAALAAVLTPFQWRRMNWQRDLRRPVGPYVGMGLCTAVMCLMQFHAVLLTDVAYVITIKRLSLLFGVIFGGLIFRETGIGARLAAASLMVAGAAVIALAPR